MEISGREVGIRDVGIPIPTKEEKMTESELRRPGRNRNSGCRNSDSDKRRKDDGVGAPSSWTESEFRRPYSGVGIGSSVCTSLPLARRVARALRCIL